MKFSSIFQLITFSLLALMSSAQDFSSDIKKINAFYEKPRMELTINYQGYSGWETKTLHEQFEGTIKKNGELKYELIGQFETIYSDTFYLTVDNQNKTIGIYPIYRGAPKKEPVLSMLDSLSGKLANTNSIKYKDISKSEGLYEIVLPAKIGLAKLYIQFFKGDHSLKKLVMFYYGPSENSNLRSKNIEQYRVEINYLKTNLKPRFSSDEFSYSKYLHVGLTGKLECNTKYLDYKLKNLMSGK